MANNVLSKKEKITLKKAPETRRANYEERGVL
jgi:hypothetical protein